KKKKKKKKKKSSRFCNNFPIFEIQIILRIAYRSLKYVVWLEAEGS
ncbi:unnamed protein product, partial [Musa acuminata subsp. burmannicoides]